MNHTNTVMVAIFVPMSTWVSNSRWKHIWC